MSAFISPVPLPLTSRGRRATLCTTRASYATRASLDADIVVIGGGVGGLAAATALRRAGRDALVLERGNAHAHAGQALGLWTNGWRALDALGVDASMLRTSHRNTNIVVQSARDGATLQTVRMSNDTEFRYVMRADLLAALRAALPAGVEVRYGTHVECVTLRNDRKSVDVALADGSNLRARAVIGADGVRSVVRTALSLEGNPRIASYRAWRGSSQTPKGVLEDLPPGKVLQIWGKGERLGATRVRDGIIHWFYTAPPPENGIDGDAEAQLRFVREQVAGWNCPIAVEIAGCEQIHFDVTKCGDRLQWTPGSGASGPLALLGDAAHLCTPNLGQGAALALEDAVELGYRVGQLPPDADISPALRAYERRRFLRNLSVGIRSAAAGELVHFSIPPLVWARNNVLAPIVMSPAIMLSTTQWSPPS